MKISKSTGVNDSEKTLIKLCDKTFLKLWSYPNPRQDGKTNKELCDLLVVFENHVFIFSDKEIKFRSRAPKTAWKSWWKKAILQQIRDVRGAESYIKKKGAIFVDNERQIPFPININRDEMIVHKIIVAHGAKDACKASSDNNIYGSLAMMYGDNDVEGLSEKDTFAPFSVHLNKDDPIHIFDSHNLEIIFNELDTVFDFSSYLDAKVEAINKLGNLSYCGEEDLLAHYFLNYNASANKHFIGVDTDEDNIDGLHIGEGEWNDFSNSKAYKSKKAADEPSYLWDEIIQTSCEHALNGTSLGESSPLRGKSAIQEMAKEPRCHRRFLSKKIIKAIQNFPKSAAYSNIFMGSFYKEKAYVFLQLHPGISTNYTDEYQPPSPELLAIACAAAKNRFKHLEKVIGIAVYAREFTRVNSDTFILMECADWTDQEAEDWEKKNTPYGFFKSDGRFIRNEKVSEFPKMEKNN